MAKMDIFEACSDGSGSGSDSDLCKIEINQDFARRLEHNKKREALQRYEEYKKQGRIADSDSGSDSDSDSSSDSEETYLTRHDSKFFDILTRLKNNDPEVLKTDVKFYESEEEDDDKEGDKKSKKEETKGKKKKEKPMYLKDIVARDLLENGPEFAGEEEITEKYSKRMYNEEQKAGLEAFMKAEKEALGSDNEESDDIFKKKERKGEDDEDDEKVLGVEKHLDAYFDKDENLDENERFLKEFFRKKSWMDKEKGKDEKREGLDDISEDEDEIERQEKYEAEYNFRHEEEGMADRVLGHSRVIEGSVRKKDSSRKQQRKSKKERMEQAEKERREELKHLKNLKKREIQEKLDRIKRIAGIGDAAGCNLGALDLEEEFDPDDYDKKMQEVFGSDYYEATDADPVFGSDKEDELEKPDFSKEDELLGLEEGWDLANESIETNDDGFEKARERYLEKKAGESADAEGITKQGKMSYKEKVDLDKELEEYYKLDYEDTIGDLKTRFKYRSVPANRYGLKPWEILDSADKDLNQYVSLKKIAPYQEKEWKVTYHQKKKKDLILGKDEQTGKKQCDKKNREGTKEEKNIQKLEDEDEKGEDQSSRKSRRRKRQAELKLPQSRLEAYGKIPPKKQKKN